MPKPTVPPEPSVNQAAIIRAMAQKAAAKHNANQDAVKAVVDSVHADARLYRFIADELLEIAAMSEILAVRAETRQDLKSSAMAFRGVDSIAALGNVRTQANIESFLDRWLVGSTPLGDCTSEELMAAIKNGNDSIAGIQQNNSFYALLVKRIGNKRVREAMSSEAASKLLANIQNAKTKAA